MCVSTLLERCWASDGPSPCGSKHLVILLFFSMNIWNCSLECNSSNRDIVPTLLLQFLWPGTRIEACFARPAGCLSIALPLSAAYSPRGDRIATQPQPAITPTSPPQQHRQDSAPQDPIGKAPPRPQDLRISKTPPRKISAPARLRPRSAQDSAPYSAQDSLLRPRSSAPFVSARRSPAPFVSARRSPAPFVSARRSPAPFVSARRSPAPFVSARRSPAPFVSARRSPAPFVSGQRSPAPFVSGQRSPAPFVSARRSSIYLYHNNGRRPSHPTAACLSCTHPGATLP